MEGKHATLDNLSVSQPCHAAWEEMPGSRTVRHCGECNRQVFNLSAMTRREAETTLNESAGRLCVRFHRGPDGAILTADTSREQKRIRRRLARFGAALLALLGFPSCITPSMGAIDVSGNTPRKDQAGNGESAEPDSARSGTVPQSGNNRNVHFSPSVARTAEAQSS